MYLCCGSYKGVLFTEADGERDDPGRTRDPDGHLYRKLKEISVLRQSPDQQVYRSYSRRETALIVLSNCDSLLNQPYLSVINHPDGIVERLYNLSSVKIALVIGFT